MATRTFILAIVLMLSGAAMAQPQSSEAEQIIADYLRMPYPEDEGLGEGRLERLALLARLKTMPDEAADAIEQVLPQVTDPRRRAELAEALGQYVPTRKSGMLLCELLKDPDEHVRWQAIHGLRMLTMRTNRMGGQRTDPGRLIEPKDECTNPLAEFAPKVEGLVPCLVSAADDPVEANRLCALYALADSRDPLAVAELRHRLKDSSEDVRLYAACFLTEYQDASGLPEMRAALARFQQTDPNMNTDFYLEAEHLLASFERITGKSFGPIPMNPLLSSDTREIPKLEASYHTLLTTWAQWWAWEPPAKPENL